jgi:hypothetical protein
MGIIDTLFTPYFRCIVYRHYSVQVYGTNDICTAKQEEKEQECPILGIHQLGFVYNHRQPYLLKRAGYDGLTVPATLANKCYVIPGLCERSTDTYHPLVVIQVIGNGTNYSFSLHVQEVKIQ